MAQKRTMKPADNRTNAASEPAPSPRVRCPLNTIENVKAELARLYREGKSGRREVNDVSKLANVLSILGRLIEGADLERRMAEIEERQAREAECGARTH